MSTAQTWTLWQRMPPRYQLTTQCFIDDDNDNNFALVGNIGKQNQSPKSRRSARSPRPYAGKIISKPTGARRTTKEFSLNKRSWSHKEDFMLSANVPEHEQCKISTSVQQHTSKNFSFPRRHSDYFSTFQKQCLVNSARRLTEMPPSPNRPSTPTTESTPPREHISTVFPVTSIDHFKGHKPKLIDRSKINGNLSHMKAKPIGETVKVDLLQFDDSKSVSSSSSGQGSRFADSKLKKYVVQDTNRATMYNDNGKIMCLGKSRHDLTHLLKAQSIRADRSTCFLAEIRRDYLKHPKYDRCRHLPRQESDSKQIANERVDYSRRVEHILSYYNENVRDTPNSMSRPTSGYRCRSPKGSRIIGLLLKPPEPSNPPSPSASPISDSQEICSDLNKLNKQSKLHDRQFFLRTPGLQQSVDMSELETCKCSMCLMELQLNLVTVQRSTNSGCESCITPPGECKPFGGNFEDMNIKEVTIESIISSLKFQRSSIDNKMNHNDPTVALPQPKVVTKVKDPRYTISCTLPEVDVVSEPEFERSRAHYANVTCQDAVANEQ